MFDWEIIIKVCLIGWFISNFEPLQNFLIKNKLFKIKIMQIPKKILQCFKCISFWIALIYTQDVYTAIICSIIAYIYIRVDNQIGYKI